MKKILLLACFLIISMSTFAQMPSIGVKSGLNIATITNPDGGNSVSSSSIATFNAGVFVDFKFGNFSLQPALNYTGKGGNYTENLYYYFPNAVPGPNISNGSGAGTEQIKEQLYYLQLPVNIVYHLPVVVGNIYFGAGPYIAQGLSGKITDSYSDASTVTTQKVTFGNSASDIKATQFGADAIIGFKSRSGILFNVNYDLGLTNDVPSSANAGSSKSRVFGISLGYVFL
jgi:hypothetical protein